MWSPVGYYAPQYGSSALATVAGVVLLILGLLVGLLSVFGLLVGVAGAAFIEEIDPTFSGAGGAFAAFFVILFGFLLVFAVLHVAAAIGVFAHRSWARWVGIILALLGLLFGGLGLIGVAADPVTAGEGLIVFFIWLTAYGFSLAALAAGGEHFAPRYPGYR